MVATTPRTSHNLALLAERSFERLGDHESLIFEGTLTAPASCSTGPAGPARGWPASVSALVTG
jgi:hypothetical protein